MMSQQFFRRLCLVITLLLFSGFSEMLGAQARFQISPIGIFDAYIHAEWVE